MRWPKMLVLPNEMRAHLCTAPPAYVFFKFADGEIVGKTHGYAICAARAMAKMRLMATTRTSKLDRCWDGSSYYWTAWRIRELGQRSGKLSAVCIYPATYRTPIPMPSPFFTVYAPFIDRFSPFLPFSRNRPAMRMHRDAIVDV